MNRLTKKLPQSHLPEKKEKNRKRERLPANPLRGSSTGNSGSSSCSNGSGSVSTSGSHRFLLSHSFSSSSSLGAVKSVAKTPKSAPAVSKPLIRKKPKYLEESKVKSTVAEKAQRCKTNPPFGKRVTSKISMKQEKGSVLKKQHFVSREVRVDDSIAQIVTPVCKQGERSDLINRSNGEAKDDCRLSNSDGRVQERTPPVQASVSPEIQCGSSVSLSAQACYAAGHLLSGVSDKRKCKPKGILTVCENGFEVGKGKILNDSDDFDEGESNISMMPLPVDASVHWLLSPCDEEEEHEKEDGVSQFEHSVECDDSPSPLSDRSTSSDLCNISSGRSLSPAVRRTSSSLSPSELAWFRRFMHLSSCEEGVASALGATPNCEVDPSEHLEEDEPSPLSVDTLGSENVIQTPESDSRFEDYFGHLSSQAEMQKKLEVGSDLETLRRTLHSARLSPQEPSSSSFNFDSLATSSDSIDLSQFQRGLVDRSSPHSPSRKHVRVSQSEERNSHMPQLKSQQITETGLHMRNNKEGDVLVGKGRELLPCSAAESISTDGGSLICSEDSNWMACYKS